LTNNTGSNDGSLSKGAFDIQVEVCKHSQQGAVLRVLRSCTQTLIGISTPQLGLPLKPAQTTAKP